MCLRKGIQYCLDKSTYLNLLKYKYIKAMDKKSLVIEFLNLSWNKGEFDRLGELVMPNFFYQTTFTDKILNLSQYIEFVSIFRQSMPELILDVEEVMCEGDRLMTHVSFSGVVEQPFFGIPASDKIIAFPAVSLWEVKENKICSLNTLIDIRGVERQLKVNLSPETVRAFV